MGYEIDGINSVIYSWWLPITGESGETGTDAGMYFLAVISIAAN